MMQFIEILVKKIKKIVGIQEPLSQSQNLTQDDLFNADKIKKEKKLNRILEKINQSGMESLTKKEKDFLKEQSH